MSDSKNKSIPREAAPQMPPEIVVTGLNVMSVDTPVGPHKVLQLSCVIALPFNEENTQALIAGLLKSNIVVARPGMVPEAPANGGAQ